MLPIDVIVQARMSSKRLPFKAMKKISDHYLIEWVILRLKKSKKINRIILATTKKKEDDILIKIAKKHKINFFRGSEHNVLNRFYNAAKFFNCNIIIRVCADNPFVDPQQINLLIKKFIKKKYDYAFNHLNKLNSLYSDGFGAEIFYAKVLKKLNKIVTSKSHKEHVTKYIWDNLKRFKVLPIIASKKLAYPYLKFDIDNEEDLKNIKKLVKNNNISINTSASNIVKIKLKNNEIKY